jgi:hypothetical protein
MAWKLGRSFKRGGKTVRYAYRNGKRSTKTLVRKVVNKKNMKKTAKTILIAGVWYMIEDFAKTPTSRERRIGRNQR